MDAAHGKAVGMSSIGVHGTCLARRESQVAGISDIGSIRGRGPTFAERTDLRQDSRLTVAVARSRRKEQSLWGMRRRMRTMVFATIAIASFGSFEPCGPQPWPAEARKHPAVAGRAPQAAPESKLFVILNEVKNLFPCEPKAACGLCLARREITNVLQSRIYSNRFFVDLPISSE